MTDQVAICNLALDAIASRSEIASLDEDSQSARTLTLHYDPAVEAILQAAHWNFARKQVALTVLKAAAGTPENPAGADTPPPTPWLYSYAIPADCVQSRYIMPDVSAPASAGTGSGAAAYAGSAVRFMLSSDTDDQGNAQTVILTNQPSAILVYTYRVTNPQLFDGQFVDALANYLGARICVRLTGDKNMAKMALQLADQMTREARASNGNEGLTVIDHIPDWMRVRGYASDWAYPAGSIFWTSPQNLTSIT